MGAFDSSVTADTPTYAVFDKAGVKTYVAYNPGPGAITVTFSMGPFWVWVRARRRGDRSREVERDPGSSPRLAWGETTGGALAGAAGEKSAYLRQNLMPLQVRLIGPLPLELRYVPNLS